MLNYTFSKTVNDCVYSIDMLYIRGYLTCSTVSAKLHLSDACDSHKSFKGRSKYSWFQDMFIFDGVTIYVGLFDDFDAMTRTWSVVPMAEIRFNPNKHSDSAWVDYFMSITDSRYIRKFDFACDIPCETKYVLVKSNRTMSSINNGECRYYGAFGSDGHVKVYDKGKEIFDNTKEKIDGSLTRIETTMTTSRLDTFIREEFYRFDSLSSNFDQIDGLNDTDICLLTLFMRLKTYEPNLALEDLTLGRKKEKKIKDALLSSSPTVHVSYDVSICSTLLDLVSVRYDCSIKCINKQLLNQYIYKYIVY